MIGHELHRSGSFWSFLLSIDKDLADSTRKQGCSCGGRLHCANYPRASRGGPDHLPEGYRCRFSFCCDRDGGVPDTHAPEGHGPRSTHPSLDGQVPAMF